MGTNGKKLSSSGLELHIELILNGNRSTDGEITPLNITNVNEQLGVFDKELGDIVKHHIFRDAQDTYRLLSDRNLALIKFSTYHAIIGHKDDRRSREDRRYVHHVFESTQKVARNHQKARLGEGADTVPFSVSSYEGLKPYGPIRDDLDLLTLKLMIAHYHDRTEEDTDRAIKKEMSELSLTVMDHLENGGLIYTLSNVDLSVSKDKVLVLKIPTDKEDLADYEGEYRGLLAKKPSIRKKVKEFIVNRDVESESEKENLFETALSTYFSSLPEYISRLSWLKSARERKHTPEAFIQFRKELTAGLLQLSEIKNSDASDLAEIVIDEVELLSRKGDELYVQSTGHIYRHILGYVEFVGESLYVPGLPALAVKHADREANDDDLDRKKPIRSIMFKGQRYTFRYFSYTPEISSEERKKKCDLTRFHSQRTTTKAETKRRKKKGRREISGTRMARAFSDTNESVKSVAHRLLSKPDGRDIVALLDINPEEAQSPGMKSFRQVFYGITRRNNAHHRVDSNREREAEVKTRLKPPTRLHNIYKSEIILSQDGLLFDILCRKYGKAVPLEIVHARRDLATSTKEVSRRLVEGVFSNHCIPGTRLTLTEAQRIYETHIEYVRNLGYEAITLPKTTLAEMDKFEFDGLVVGFLDARVRGIRHPMKIIYQNKDFTFGTSVALEYLARRFSDDDSFFLPGLDFRGVNPISSIKISTD
jgi:hypothetical protein